MEKHHVFVVKLYANDGSTTYVGKNSKIKDPWSYQLFEFAKNHGFASEQEAIEYSVSYYRGGAMTEARVLPLEIW